MQLNLTGGTCAARLGSLGIASKLRSFSRAEHLTFAIVIRCLLRPSNELRRAMEVLNRCIGGGRKRDPTTDLRDIENSDADTVSSRIETSRPPRRPSLRRAHSCIVSRL